MANLINPDQGMRFAYLLTSGPDDGSSGFSRARAMQMFI
jgi:hypothetical protein